MKAPDYTYLLITTLVPIITPMGQEYVFHDDKAPCHHAKSVASWLSTKNIQKFEYSPPQSPDINSIEHVWDILETKLEVQELERIERKAEG